jgi:tRNA A-37 threonylcarbamoyl transferase component Bud32
VEAGEILAGAYRLLHPIGEGGMGRVWVADQIVLERRVAIKLLSPEIVETGVGRELFEREARATARVDHPHVVRVVDYAVTNEGVPFLVLELLDGETLEERIQRSGPVSLADARTILAQTADALGYAHDSGILHRDIKAENIFLRRRARKDMIDVKLLDFGVALHRARPMVHSMGIVGTPAYMGPEQITGGELDERCDLFSLGVCIYYALTGQFPYRGDTVEEVELALAEATYVPVTKLRPDLPPSLDAWFTRALATSPSDRFACAETMDAAFERAIEAQRDTPVAHAATMPPITIERAPRRRGYAALVGAIIASVAIVAYARLGAPRIASMHAAPHVATTTAAAAPSITADQPIIADVAPVPTPAVTLAPAAKHHIKTTRPKPRTRAVVEAGPVDTVIDAGAFADAPEPESEPVIEGTEGFGNRQ